MSKTHHGRMEHKLNLKEKHNLGRMASPSNQSTKSKALHKKIYQNNIFFYSKESFYCFFFLFDAKCFSIKSTSKQCFLFFYINTLKILKKISI